MSHLIEVYAKDLGVQIKHKPFIKEHFYPLPKNGYVTIHTSDKVPAKNYSYWDEVVKILKPELEKRDIKLVQVGTNEDPRIDGVDFFFNFTTFKQSFFLLKNSLCHVGIDSSPVHICSAYNVPTVSVYHTYAENCGPLWNKEKAKVIETHRNGKKPSFSLREDPKTIDLIKPEEIAENCFAALGFEEYKSRKTLLIGKKFLHKTVDIIPEKNPQINLDISNCNIRVRMDLTFNEQVLLFTLQKSPKAIQIVTNRAINPEILSFFKGKIEKIIYTTGVFDEKFMEFLKNSGILFELNCNSKKDLNDQRFKYFHFDIVYFDEKKKAKKLKKKNIENFRGQNTKELRIDCGKFYVLGDKTLSFLTNDYEKWKFWVDIPYCWVYLDR